MRTLVPGVVLAAASACTPAATPPPAANPAVPAASSSSVAGLVVEPCTLPGVQGPARCGTLEVWENRAARSGRRIPIRFVVIPGTETGPAREALTYLAGGPGSAATNAAGWITSSFGPSREGRDVLLVDQRGTGGSYPLHCGLYGSSGDAASFLGAFMPAEGVRACVPELERKADLAHYTSDPAADDLDEVRAALGYERLDLFGASYGTRTALVYMRRHPERVRSAILLGVVPTDASSPLDFARDADRALYGVVAECEAEAACRAAFPELRANLRRSLERLAHGPVEVEVVNPATGEPVRFPFTRDLYAEGMRYLLYGVGTSGLIPVMVQHAARGDFGPIAEFALDRRMNMVNAGSHAVFLAVTCAEDVPFADPAEGARRAAGTFLGDYRLRDQRAACAEWPRAPIDPGFRGPVVSDAPTLILSGQWDPVTPPSGGEQVARHLRNSLHVVVPSGAHGFGGLENASCVDRLMNDFVRAASVAALDTSCVGTIRRRPFRTEPIQTQVARVEPAALARLAGEYQAQGFTATVAVNGERLEMTMPQGRWVLVPLSPTRFRRPGSVNLNVVFETEGGRARAMRLEDGGVPTLTATRK